MIHLSNKINYINRIKSMDADNGNDTQFRSSKKQV